MAIHKKITDDNELYLYMNGKLIYKRWLNEGYSKVFDHMAYGKDTLESITEDSKGEVISRRKILLNGYTINSLEKLWDSYCRQIPSESANLFGRNLDALNDAICHEGPGFPGDALIEIIGTAELQKSIGADIFQSIIEIMISSEHVQLVLEKKKWHQVLDGLPAYGPMYIPISESGEPFYNEGYVIEFITQDDSSWVANFQHGLTELCTTYEFNSNSILIVAGGQVYLMNPNNQEPLQIFGGGYKESIIYNDKIVLISDTCIDLISDKGILWKSPRISFDGIDKVTIKDSTLQGKSYDPMNDADEWIDFSIDLETREVQGGSYRKYYSDEDEPKHKKKWWQF